MEPTPDELVDRYPPTTAAARTLRRWAGDESRHIRCAVAGWEVWRVGKHDLLPSSAWLPERLRRSNRRLAA
jgi:hypothetical protein